MKKTLVLALLGLVWSSQGKALTWGTGVSQTAATGESASVANSPMWGLDNSVTPNVNRQAMMDSNGNLKVTGVWTGSPTGVGPNFTGPFYACITFTAFLGAANGVTIASAVASRNTVVTAWGLSSDTAARLTLHFGSGAATRSNGTTSTIIGGGLYGSNSGESKSQLWEDSNAQNTQVSLDVSVACNVECWIEFYNY